MSQENHPNNDSGKLTKWLLLLWEAGVAWMMILILAFVMFVLLRLLLPSQWGFSIEAKTEVAEVRIPEDTETRWLIDGATICVRGNLKLPEVYESAALGNPCGSRAWSAWKSADPEQVLRLNGDVSATLQIRPEGGFAASLRALNDQSLGYLSIVGITENIEIGTAINLLWEEVPEASITLPFSGATTLGRTVSWSSNRILNSGSVAVYTADESADKRTKVDATLLMLGDQVQLGVPDKDTPWPKGFIRVVKDASVMQVVAFGQAGGLQIERFGESGYDFRPSRIRKLAADPALAFWGSVLAAYMTLILGLHPFIREEENTGTGKNLLSRIISFGKKMMRWKANK